MWLSERAGVPAETPGAHAQVGTVTIGGSRSAVLLHGECRDLETAGAPGVLWRPAVGSQVLVAETDEGEKFILGAVEGGEARPDPAAPALAEGELCLRAGRAWLKLGRTGDLSAQGNLYLTGDVSITGRLFLNGTEVTPAPVVSGGGGEEA